MGKADTEEVGVYLGGAKYFIALSIAHCDWVVYAVNAGDKPMGCSLSLRDGPWQKIKINLSAPSVRRPTGKMPGMPDYQSSPACDPLYPPFHTVCICPLVFSDGPSGVALLLADIKK